MIAEELLSDPSYAVAIPILEKIRDNLKLEKVIECGMGRFSTEFFLEKCPDLDLLISYELDQEWYDWGMSQWKNRHEWVPMLFKNPSLIFSMLDRHLPCDLILLDFDSATLNADIFDKIAGRVKAVVWDKFNDEELERDVDDLRYSEIIVGPMGYNIVVDSPCYDVREWF